jgi:hypothetical protein
METPKIFPALNAVQKALTEVGIAKDQENKFDKYKYRGIDDVYNAVGPLLAEHGVMIAPTVVNNDCTGVQTSQGKPAFHTKITVNYTLYASDGSNIICTVPGEAMDRGDKGEQKAMSAAYKNLVFQFFCIPVEGQDSESESHEIAPEFITSEQVMALQNLLGQLDDEGQGKVNQWLKSKGVNVLEEVKSVNFASVEGAIKGLVAKALQARMDGEQDG